MPVSDDELLRPRQVDSSVTLKLQLQGTPIVLPSTKQQDDQNNQSNDDNSDSGEPELKPQIMLLSSGELTPFKITVSGAGDDSQYVITGDLLHGIRLERPGDHSNS